MLASFLDFHDLPEAGAISGIAGVVIALSLYVVGRLWWGRREGTRERQEQRRRRSALVRRDLSSGRQASHHQQICGRLCLWHECAIADTCTPTRSGSGGHR